MSDQIAVNPRDLEAVMAACAPWVSIDEMCQRYRVASPKTICAMEQRGEIPKRKGRLWSRVQLMQWEAEQLKKAA